MHFSIFSICCKSSSRNNYRDGYKPVNNADDDDLEDGYKPYQDDDEEMGLDDDDDDDDAEEFNKEIDHTIEIVDMQNV